MTIILQNDDCFVFAPDEAPSAPEKNSFVAYSQLFCAAHGVQAAVVAMQGWALKSSPGTSFAPTVNPSQSPQLREYIWLCGEAPGGLCEQRFLSVVRDQQGRFSKLGAQVVIRGFALNRFIHVLPQTSIPEDIRTLATDLLGIKDGTPVD